MFAAEVLGGVFCCVFMLGVFGVCLYVDHDAKRKSHARFAELERRREESRAYWAARISEAAAQQTRVTTVAPVPTPPHNLGRRRMLPLN